MDTATMREKIQAAVRDARATGPLAGSITNTVTINLVANAQLAVGGSAAMVYFADEAEGLAEMGGAFYVNVGTFLPSYASSIPAVGDRMHQLGKPLVLDPVGIGLGSLRSWTLSKLKEDKPAIVRGNASEIIALARLWGLDAGTAGEQGPRGVDSVDEVDDAVAAARAIAEFTGGAVAISGEADTVVSAQYKAVSHGGSTMMKSITGMGCSQGGVIAVYAAVADPFTAALTGVQIYNFAGAQAAQRAKGTGSMQVEFLDALSTATPEDVAANAFEIEEW